MELAHEVGPAGMLSGAGPMEKYLDPNNRTVTVVWAFVMDRQSFEHDRGQVEDFFCILCVCQLHLRATQLILKELIRSSMLVCGMLFLSSWSATHS